MVKCLPANEAKERQVQIPGSGRSPGGGNGNPFQYACLENPMDRRAWQVPVHEITKSRTQLKQLSTHAGSKEISTSTPGNSEILPKYLISRAASCDFLHLLRHT